MTVDKLYIDAFIYESVVELQLKGRLVGKTSGISTSVTHKEGTVSVFLMLIRNRSRYSDLLQPYWLITGLPRLVLVSCIPPNST